MVLVTISEWNERYGRRTGHGDFEPTPLVVSATQDLKPGKALDLACGTGRNALWLAHRGWEVTAVDGSEAAVSALLARAKQLGVAVDEHVADLTKSDFKFMHDAWDLVLICYYLQRDLFEAAKRSVRPGGLIIAIVHICELDEQPTDHRLAPGELARYFSDWSIIHSYEGRPQDPQHKRAVAEIIARRPV